MEWWEEQKKLKEERELEKKKYPLLGTIVKFSGEYGVLVKDEDSEGRYLVRWDNKRESDFEEFAQLNYEYPTDYELKHINPDGTLKTE